MRKIKLIASDLDGTLLRNDESLSSYTRAVLARCRKKGVLFFVATARPPRSLERLIPGLSYDGAICHNGGVVTLGGKIVWEQGIPPETAGALARHILQKFSQARLSAEISGELYANFDGSDLWPGIDFTLTDFSSFPEKPAEKFIVSLNFSGAAEKVTALLPEGLAAQVSEHAILMIQPKEVEKGKTLETVCRRFGISPAETVAFGDDWNDISLLNAAGTGVAVENALSEVKTSADEICASNEEDGPAKWLEEHLLR